MQVTFVAISWESLGISQLSSIAKQRGHQVNLVFSPALFNDRNHLTIPSVARHFDDKDIILKSIEKQNPDVLAFSAVTATYQWLLSIAVEAKKILPHVKVIFGGIHTTAVPDYVLAKSVVDYVCIGEGDIAFPLILESIEKNDYGTPIVNTRYKTSTGEMIQGKQIGFIQDLDALPIFDKPLWEDYMQIGESYITMTSRGCPYRCSYCFNSYFPELSKKDEDPLSVHTKYLRRRSIDHVLYELKLSKKRYNLRLIEFFDDIFTADKKWLKSFLYQYKREINVKFQIFTHVQYIDEEVAQWLSAAGCIGAQIGIQSLDEDYKRRILNRHETNAQAEFAIKVLKKYKINPKFDHMFGLPGEPMDAFETARKFYVNTPPARIQTYWTNYFPGIKIIRTALDLNLLKQEDIVKINEGIGFDSFTISNKNIDQTKIKKYRIYELIFKLLPICPKAFRSKLTLNLFQYMPNKLCPILSFMIDLLSGILTLNHDLYQYLGYYLYHIRRLVFLKFKIKPKPATIVSELTKKDFKIWYNSKRR